MKIVNLTPHAVNIIGGETYASSGVARVSEVETQVGEAGGIPLFSKKFGEVVGLPEPQQDTMLIVSMMVKAAAPHRSDLLVPTKLVRDEKGNIIGCQGFAV
jgi:hypothetical protein